MISPAIFRRGNITLFGRMLFGLIALDNIDQNNKHCH